jgi:threonine dehydrogenase-like Zn-dependent dehydrogenase
VRALVLTAEGRLVLDPEHPEPVLGEGDALVHVRQAGVCATDLELIRGYAGYTGILGHEFVGIVDPGDPHWPGRRVVADINLGCGRCPSCLSRSGRGGPHHCRARTTLGIRGRPGVFAERVAIPRANLVAVPDSVPDDAAVFAEPLAAAAHVLDELDQLDALDPPSTAITVLGDGKLGILIALALAGAGCKVELIGRHPHKLAIAAAAAAQLEQDRLTTLLEPELGPDPEPRAGMVVDATGSPAGLARALSLVEPRGTVVLKTTTATPMTIDLTPVVIHELRVIGSRCGDLEQAIALLAAGRVDPRPLIAARYPLADGPRAIDQASRRGTLEVILEMGA